jgi:AbiTii
MKLLNELISNLSGEQPSLTDALMKTKVLLHQLGRKDLVAWVNLELDGYSNDVQVPEYRVVNAQVRASISDGFHSQNDQPLPTHHLAEDIRLRFERCQIRESVSTLEVLARKDTIGTSISIPPEFYGLLEKGLADYNIQEAKSFVAPGRLGQVLTQVRSRLLDFLLELSEKIGDETMPEQIKRIGESPATASMFNHAMFGDNVTILIGDRNQQTVTNQIVKGDFETLKSILKERNVQSTDIEELRLAIAADADGEDVRAKRFGPRVRGWMKSMLAKAVDASWQIEIGVVSSFLYEALKSYYGW